LKCPSCGAESKFSFIDGSYEGPRRCWKCHGLFKMKIVNNVLVYCNPITQEEFEQMQNAHDLKLKYQKPSE
jgi:phage/plasmid primase-like uncharacterized protein